MHEKRPFFLSVCNNIYVKEINTPNGEFIIRNRFDFTNEKEYSITYTIE